MPTNKNAMTRYRIIDRLLSDKYHAYTIDDIVEEVNKSLAELDPDTDGVGRRCIEKDIKYLEEGPFVAEIERYSATGYSEEKQRNVSRRCLRYADASFSIFKQPLTDDEKQLLGEAMSLLGNFDGLPDFDGLDRLRQSLGMADDNRKIISLSHNPLAATNTLARLYAAISHRQVIELHYHKFGDEPGALVINLHPYLLKEFNNRWFLYASAETNGRLLCFGLERIDDIVPLPSHTYVDYFGEGISEVFDDVVGVTLSITPILDIVIWVSDSQISYVATKPIHESQKRLKSREAELRARYPRLKGGMFFGLRCRRNYELVRELSAYGPHLIVLTPKVLRREVQERAIQMAAAYTETFL